MNTADAWAELALLSFTVAGVVAAYAGPLRWARTAAWRQDLFELRNDLWDRMRERDSLDEPAHRKIRELINLAIRLAPGMNLFSFTYVIVRGLLWGKSPPVKAEKTIPELIAEVKSPIVAEELQQAMEAICYQLLWRLFIFTFPGMLIGIPLLISYRCFSAAKICARFRSKCRDGIRTYLEMVGDMGPSIVPA